MERKLSTLGEGCHNSAQMLVLLTILKDTRCSVARCVGEDVMCCRVQVPPYGRGGLATATGYQKRPQKRFPGSEDSPLPLQVVETLNSFV